jgi:3-oxo-4-pregnene-20-carboxyl-CoA dehydrogenase alpha subunit
MRGVSALAERAAGEEARQFAASVRAIVERHAPPDPWQPGAAVSDADPGLDAALAEAGWKELGNDRALLALAAPAAAELGRGFASLAPVDRLLGGALRVGDLARYAEEGTLLVEPRAGELIHSRAERLTSMPYTDALGVAKVEAVSDEEKVGAGGMAAWTAASTGYLAGVAGEALRLALDHARSRRAFGAPLAALEPVQQMLADAATLADGLRLLAADTPGLDALAYAGPAAERTVATCMQVTGALGFTLEFPLQRAYRRTRSARAWADRALVAWEERAG